MMSFNKIRSEIDGKIKWVFDILTKNPNLIFFVCVGGVGLREGKLILLIN